MNQQSSIFNLFDYFLGDQRVEEFEARVAIEFRGRSITYRQLRGEVADWMTRLKARGIGEGDRVAMLVYDSPEFIAGFLATIALGAINVPINTYLTKEEILFIIRDSGARLIISERNLVEKLANIDDQHQAALVIDDTERPSLGDEKSYPSCLPPAATAMSTPAFILYTSGSTGTPKGALHLHKNMMRTVEGFGKNILKLTSDDKVFSASRLFFAYGLGNSLSFPLQAGACVILETERPTAEKIASLFSEQHPTVFYAVPSVFQALLNYHKGDRHLDLTSLRLCISAGEALPATVFHDWRKEFGLTILDGIGSTEMLHMFISNREGRARAGSSGEVVPGYEAAIIDDAGNRIEGAGTGKLIIKGDSAMSGYWNREELTEAVLQDGWMRTGDVYRRDNDNYYDHIGRSDDCFKVKGLWISPIEIESVLIGHEAVREAAVVAGSDENGLATVKAFVVIGNESAGELLKLELIELVRSKLPPYKTPKDIELISELPRTSTGKIQRFKLRN